jgi:predicted small secreted protein
MRAMRLLSLLALVSFAFAVSGCRTVRGFGEDLERGGQRLQDKAVEEEYDD